jgi:hypothetical protein
VFWCRFHKSASYPANVGVRFGERADKAERQQLTIVPVVIGGHGIPAR